MSKSPGSGRNGRSDEDLVREATSDPNFGATVFQNFMDLWFAPEIERRKAAGQIGEDFVLFFAQALFPDEGERQIRLNDEVKGVMVVEAQNLGLGNPVTLADLEHVQGFELIDEELDCGHFTLIRRPQGWMISFNALAGRKKAANLVRLAREFLASAKYSRDLGHSGPSIDNLFSCCELLSKAELIMHRSTAAKSRTHGTVHSAMHAWARLGNAPPEFVSVMKRMFNLRSAARYEGTTASQHLPTDNEFAAVDNFAQRLNVASRTRV